MRRCAWNASIAPCRSIYARAGSTCLMCTPGLMQPGVVGGAAYMTAGSTVVVDKLAIHYHTRTPNTRSTRPLIICCNASLSFIFSPASLEPTLSASNCLIACYFQVVFSTGHGHLQKRCYISKSQDPVAQRPEILRGPRMYPPWASRPRDRSMSPAHLVIPHSPLAAYHW